MVKSGNWERSEQLFKKSKNNTKSLVQILIDNFRNVLCFYFDVFGYHSLSSNVVISINNFS